MDRPPAASRRLGLARSLFALLAVGALALAFSACSGSDDSASAPDSAVVTDTGGSLSTDTGSTNTGHTGSSDTSDTSDTDTGTSSRSSDFSSDFESDMSDFSTSETDVPEGDSLRETFTNACEQEGGGGLSDYCSCVADIVFADGPDSPEYGKLDQAIQQCVSQR